MQKPNSSRRQSQLDVDVDVLVAILSSCENGGVFGAIAFLLCQKNVTTAAKRVSNRTDISVEIFA